MINLHLSKLASEDIRWLKKIFICTQPGEVFLHLYIVSLLLIFLTQYLWIMKCKPEYFRNLYWLILIGLLGCNNNDDDIANGARFEYNFNDDTEGWIGDFADYPVGEDDFYELEYTYSPLPEPLNQNDGSLKLSGNNHSDDLFMFVKRKVSGLGRNTSYNINFEIEFASNIPDETVGIGGSPGESVYIKAGATPTEPVVNVGSDGLYTLNIDKGNQSQEGNDMVVIGDFSNDTDEDLYHLKTVSNTGAFTATTNENGELWIIVGTDSGFEGTTTIYYNKISIIVD